MFWGNQLIRPQKLGEDFSTRYSLEGNVGPNREINKLTSTQIDSLSLDKIESFKGLLGKKNPFHCVENPDSGH